MDGRNQGLRFRLEPEGTEVAVRPEIAILAGYTGRDQEAVHHHIHELEALGVAPPPNVPMFYFAAPELLIQGSRLLTTESGTSGEVEVALVVDGDDVYVTVASDHTDRALERIDVPASKRACPKVIGSTAWRLGEVVGHWDTLRLESWIGEAADQPYQDGLLGELLGPVDLLEAIHWRVRPTSFVLLGGTMPAIGGLRESPRFRASLHDPVHDRRLEIDYAVQVLDFVRAPSSAAARVRTAAQELGIALGDIEVARLGSRVDAIEEQLQP